MTQTKLTQVPRTLKSLYEELEMVQDALRVSKETEKNIKQDILDMYADKMKTVYAAKNEPFGSINFNEGNLKITFTTPKTVSWEQDGLKSLLEDGAPVDVEYSVKEKVYQDLNQAGKDCFLPYRTVKPGAVTIKFEVKDA